jgi:hypothetical protein
LNAHRFVYPVYLVLFPILLAGFALLGRQAAILSSMTYLPTYRLCAEFFLPILSGILIAADLWFMHLSKFSGKTCYRLKLADLVFLIVLYCALGLGFFAFIPGNPFLSVSALLYAAGYQGFTAFFFLRRAIS